MEFLRNTWYVAAWAEELKETLLARIFLNEPVVLFRDTAGKAKALQDRCPHRFAPLSLGRIDGDRIVCGYHGLVFDGSGHCVLNPHKGQQIPARAKVKSYPIVERHALLWIWMGDPALADAAAIPDFSHLEDPTLRQIRGSTRYACHYEIHVDNLMDLSHANFLHGNMHAIDGFDSMQHAVTQEGNTIHSRLSAFDIPPPAVYAQHLPDPSKPVDLWLDTSWQAPSICLVNAGVTPAGQPKSEGMINVGTHIVTPETDTSCHYFYSSSRNFRQDDEEADRKTRAWQQRAFLEEDKPMVEACQRRMGTADLMALQPILLPTDAGAMRVRRTLSRLIQEERASATA